MQPKFPQALPALSAFYDHRVIKICTFLTSVHFCSCDTPSSYKVPFRYFWESPRNISPLLVMEPCWLSRSGACDTHHFFPHFLPSNPSKHPCPHWTQWLLPLGTTMFTRHQPPVDTSTTTSLCLPYCCESKSLTDIGY